LAKGLAKRGGTLISVTLVAFLDLILAIAAVITLFQLSVKYRLLGN
jgi:hypothetical protein